MRDQYPEIPPVSLKDNPDERRWYVNPEGIIVGAHFSGWRYYIERSGFVPLQMWEERSFSDENWCIISRPRGGLGDIMCMIPAIDFFLSENCDKYDKVYLRFPKQYKYLFRDILSRYKVKYLNQESYKTIRRNDFALAVNIWCPAGLHEQKTQYRPLLSRIDNFAVLLGVPSRRFSYRPPRWLRILSYLRLYLLLRKKTWISMLRK